MEDCATISAIGESAVTEGQAPHDSLAERVAAVPGLTSEPRRSVLTRPGDEQTLVYATR